LNTLNTELAERIIGLILMEPERLAMGTWVSETGTVAALKADCGTAACIASHAALLTLPPDAQVTSAGCTVVYPDGTVETVPAAGARALGLEDDVADVLFSYPDDHEAVPALKYLIGNPGATGDDLENFLDEGRA
jgi:hypothetical protein